MDQQTSDHPGPPAPRPDPAFLVGLVYGLLAVLGVMLGVIGSFEFSWELGDIPIAAVLLSLVNLIAFRTAGWAMESRLGAAVPALLWLVVLLLLASRRPEGDLVVTGTAPGYIYMFGGSVAAMLAVAWTRPSRPWPAPQAPPAPLPGPEHEHGRGRGRSG